MSTACRRVTYRLYPSAAQKVALFAMLATHRFLYNAPLQKRRDAYRLQRLSISLADQCKSLTKIRREDAELKAVNAQSCQVRLERLDLAYTAFFRRCTAGGKAPGLQRCKSKNRFEGWGYNICGDGFRFTSGAHFRNDKLRLSGIGIIKARGEAGTPGEVVSCDVKRDASGDLFL